MSTRQKLFSLWQPWDDVGAALDAFASTPDEIRELDLDELTELIRFQDDLERTARCLKNTIRAAAGEIEPLTFVVGIIDSFDHPVLVMLRNRAQGFRDLAAKIRRTWIR